jgi:hypothetical protein
LQMGDHAHEVLISFCIQDDTEAAMSRRRRQHRECLKAK